MSQKGTNTHPFLLTFLFIKLVTAEIAQSDLFPYDTANDQQFRFGDDSFMQVNLQVPFNFFNTTYNTTFLSGNGQVSFGQGINTFTPACSPSTTPMIMSYWADSVHDSSTHLLYRQTTNRTLLRKAASDVFSAFPQLRGIILSWMLIVTWNNVPFYGSSSNCDGRFKRNTYQLVLTSDGYHSFAIMYYNRIDWTTGAHSNSKGNCNGLGGHPAKAGFDYGDGKTLYTVPGSCSNSIINITQSSNINQPGKWVFRIDANLETATCDTFDSSKQKLKLSPNIVSYVGLLPLKIEGPCLQQGANASCIFHDFNLTVPLDIEVDGLISSDFKSVSCQLPVFQQVGRKKVDLKVIYPIRASETIEVAEKDGGNANMKIYSGFLYIMHEEDMGEYLEFSFEASSDDNETLILNASWDPAFFQNDDDSDISDSNDDERAKRAVMSAPLLLNIVLQVHDHDGHKWKEVGVLKHSIPNIGSFRGPIGTQVLESIQDIKDMVTPVVTMVQSEMIPALLPPKILGAKASATLIQLALFTPGLRQWSCHQWYQTTSPSPTDIRPCPPNYEQATNDRNFEDDNDDCEYLHGEHRYRSKRQAVASNSGAGSQCKYDKDGNLVVGAPGGGSTDRFSPNANVPLHFLYDVLPYNLCCNLHRNNRTEEMENCNIYYDARHSDNGDEYVPPRVTRAVGDPHITTFDGLSYTFNGVGEFWMVKFKDELEFKMQARMQQYLSPTDGTKVNASVFTAVAMEEVRNGERVKVQVSYDDDKILVLLDDEPVDIDEYDRVFTVHHKSSSVTFRSSQEVHVTFSSSFSFQFSTVGPNEVALNIIGSGNPTLMNVTQGLMGNFDGDPENDLKTPGGILTLPTNSTPQIIHYDFGLEWMVREDESIFTYPPGKSYSDYCEPNFTPRFLTDIDITELSQSVIDTCGGYKDCLFDFVTTGSVVFANETRTSSLVFEHIVEVSQKGVKMCISLPTPENGHVRITNYVVGAGKAEFHCENNYHLENGPVRCFCTDSHDGQIARWICDGSIQSACVRD